MVNPLGGNRAAKRLHSRESRCVLDDHLCQTDSNRAQIPSCSGCQNIQCGQKLRNRTRFCVRLEGWLLPSGMGTQLLRPPVYN